MANKRTRWSESTAGKKAAQDSGTGRNYVKIDALVEVPFTITAVEFEPSDFDAEQEQVVITFTFDNDEGTTDEGIEYTLTTTRNSIIRAMRHVTDDELPIGPVTVYESGVNKQYGTVYYKIGETVPDIDAHPVIEKPVQRDVSVDRKRQELSGRLPKRG